MKRKNEDNEITRYKAKLTAQGFSQRPDIDYEKDIFSSGGCNHIKTFN